MWWSDYGNTPAGFDELKANVDQQIAECGRTAGSVSATCAVFVQLPGGAGRQMGGYGGKPVEPVRGTAADVADHLRLLADAGAEHVQLCVDPITRDSVEWFAEMLTILDR